MSKALESALEAVRRMSPGSEIDPALWRELLEEISREAALKILRDGQIGTKQSDCD